MSDPVDLTETLSDTVPETERGYPPRILGGRYLLEERVATGGMASVWRAHDEKLARTVAVKVLHEHLAADEAFRERFRREAISAAKLAHPNVVGVYDTGSDSGWVYLVMEYVDGVTLLDVIADLGTLEPGHAAAIGEQVARALDYAHARGVVHRDVKPANILIGAEGLVKVADFGIAKAEESGGDLTRAGVVLGTAAYVAPEQIMAHPVDGRADQYSLGCMLYQMLTGHQPFKADSPMATAAARLEAEPLPIRSFRTDVPRGLDAVVMRALSRQPEGRFPTAAAFADALATWSEGDPTQGIEVGGAAGNVTITADPDEEQPTPRDATTTGSFLRSEGRWLAPVLALVALAGALAAVGALTGVIEPDAIPNLRARLEGSVEQAAADRQAPPERAAPTSQPITVTGLDSLDPQGEPQTENDDDLPSLIDDDPDTSWRTDLYHSERFGNLKDGVGVVFDLGGAHTVTGMTVRTPTPGITFDVRVADQPHQDPAAWQTVESVTDAPETIQLQFDSGEASGRYALVWITPPLAPVGNRWAAALSDVALTGVPR